VLIFYSIPPEGGVSPRTLQLLGNSYIRFDTGGSIRAICLGMRECCLKRDQLIDSVSPVEAVEADQSSFRGKFPGAGDGILDGPRGQRPHR